MAANPTYPNPTMSSLSRRDFLLSSALLAGAASLTGATPELDPSRSRAKRPSGKEPVRFAGIACGGKGESDIMEMFNAGAEVIAVCDVDTRASDKILRQIKGKFPNVRVYQDYRKLLDRERDLHAVTVSTPDHMHAPISLAAMERGLSVYCQKPLSWCLNESREMKRMAAKMGVTTQMGNQGSGNDVLRRTVEAIQAGLLGDVTEVHAWTNRPIWPQGIDRPKQVDPVPAELDWNLWLGVAEERPYVKDAYHAFNWRGFKDFGTGALGDMACHLLNMPFRALQLGSPTSMQPELDGNWAETYSRRSKVRFEFPARGKLPALTLYWYEGGLKPDKERVSEVLELQKDKGQLPGNGVVIRGSKGMLYQGDDYGSSSHLQLKGEEKAQLIVRHPAVKAVPITLPRTNNHYREWLEAVSTGASTYSDFDIAGPLTEFVQLGCLAQRVNQRLEWDATSSRVTNSDAANAFLRRKHRSGW